MGKKRALAIKMQVFACKAEFKPDKNPFFYNKNTHFQCLSLTHL